ncbi:hypothetical protein PP645_001691 [Vibrio vulnificus]|nr:hypothetical protein [Vibrio vulnificus]
MRSLDVHIPEALVPESDNIIDFLSGYDVATTPYDGDFTSDWLLTPVDAPVWVIKKRNTVKTTKAEKAKTGRDYKYAETVIWERLLPDGSYLTDQQNAHFLYQLQRLVFLVIEDPINQERMATSRIKSFTGSLLNFVSWVFLHKARFQPLEFGLSKVSASDVEVYGNEMINGGTFHTLAVGQKILSKVGLVLGKERNPCFLEASEVEIVERYFREHDLYKLNLRGIEIVDRIKVNAHFNTNKHDLMSHEATLFLRQLEPDLLKLNDKVLLPANLSTKYPSHKTPLIRNFLKKKYSSRYITQFIPLYEKGFQYVSLFPGFLGNSETFTLGDMKAKWKRRGAPPSHTPWIPLDDALLLINKSINIIINHSDDILKAYEDVIGHLYENKILSRSETSKLDILVQRLPDALLKEFNVVSFYKLDSAFKNCDDENKLSFVCLTELLQASCLLIIAGLKPIRIEELALLPYDCLYFQEGDGYWLEQRLMKSGISDLLPETAKPIPTITAKAINILRKFNDFAKKWGTKVSKKESDYLLYRLNLGNENTRGSIMDNEKIKMLLEKFCDYFGTSVDEYGRRWYVNIHELRKSFLLTFFWTFKNSSIDACQWIAGHKDPDHILDYIESSNPGEEMTDLEAEYARQQMTYFYENSSLLEMQNIEELYQLVCDHFKVKDYTDIEEDDLHDYLELLLMKGTYQIEFFSMGDSFGLINEAKVAFKVVKL